ncbi:endonuclease domain-containing protein [Herbiconiux sp. P17]|uniref:endonuclease domain-containing protein n=1 Tax=Herbiconiux wuyangfengii TaxID=3342794 RepID=UPI0035B93D44
MREGAESRPESHLRLLLVGAGLPEPELNQEIFDSAGRWVARVDMVYRSERVIVEYDGDHHRTDPVQYEKDLRRVETLRDNGWTVIHVRKSGLYRTPAETLSRVTRALSVSRGAR